MEHPQKRKIKRPISLYILTICIFLRFGVFQLISDFSLIRENGGETPFLIATILIGRNIFVSGAAVWAFSGENWGRISLLTIVSLNVLWTVFNLITYISYSESDQIITPVLSTSLNPLFWLILCWWYLNKKNVVEYYKQND